MIMVMEVSECVCDIQPDVQEWGGLRLLQSDISKFKRFYPTTAQSYGFSSVCVCVLKTCLIMLFSA